MVKAVGKAVHVLVFATLVAMHGVSATTCDTTGQTTPSGGTTCTCGAATCTVDQCCVPRDRCEASDCVAGYVLKDAEHLCSMKAC